MCSVISDRQDIPDIAYRSSADHLQILACRSDMLVEELFGTDPSQGNTCAIVDHADFTAPTPATRA